MNNNQWYQKLKDEFFKKYFVDLIYFLDDEYEKYNIYPKRNEIFKALKMTDFDDVKVVIIGQDPYHQPNQAHGLAFSVPDGVKFPPSLINIYKELVNDLGIPFPKTGNLSRWAQQGVLLLNTVLTVREGRPQSHRDKGWEIFTDQIINILNQKTKPIIYLLWGNDAKAKSKLIAKHHYILTAAHPSPLSAHRGFFGCRHFSKANNILRHLQLPIIDWRI